MNFPQKWARQISPILAVGLLIGLSTKDVEAAVFVAAMDDFDEGVQDLRTSGEETLQSIYESSDSSTSILGGARELEFVVTQNPQGRLASLRVQAGPGRLESRLRTGTEGQVTIRYNRGGTGLGGIDLRSGGANGVGFDFVSATADLGIDVRMTDTSGRTASGIVFQAEANPSEPVTLLFDDFSNSAGADFSAADSIEFTFSPAPAGDFRLGGIARYDIEIPIPEPAAGSLLLVAVGLLGRRRRMS